MIMESDTSHRSGLVVAGGETTIQHVSVLLALGWQFG